MSHHLLSVDSLSIAKLLDVRFEQNRCSTLPGIYNRSKNCCQCEFIVVQALVRDSAVMDCLTKKNVFWLLNCPFNLFIYFLTLY